MDGGRVIARVDTIRFGQQGLRFKFTVPLRRLWDVVPGSRIRGKPRGTVLSMRNCYSLVRALETLQTLPPAHGTHYEVDWDLSSTRMSAHVLFKRYGRKFETLVPYERTGAPADTEGGEYTECRMLAGTTTVPAKLG